MVIVDYISCFTGGWSQKILAEFTYKWRMSPWPDILTQWTICTASGRNTVPIPPSYFESKTFYGPSSRWYLNGKEQWAILRCPSYISPLVTTTGHRKEHSTKTAQLFRPKTPFTAFRSGDMSMETLLSPWPDTWIQSVTKTTLGRPLRHKYCEGTKPDHNHCCLGDHTVHLDPIVVGTNIQGIHWLVSNQTGKLPRTNVTTRRLSGVNNRCQFSFKWLSRLRH